MSFRKTAAIIAAAGAFAAFSVPAMALENEFHGTYTFNTIFSNFQDGASGDYNPTTKPDKIKTNNYFEQRARLQYIAKVSDDLKLVTHFELDTRFGGINDNKYTSSTDAGVLDADGISLETKHVYLDFNIGKSFNVKTGIMPYKDTIKGLLIDADVPAIYTTTKLGDYTLGVGFSRFSEDYQGAGATTTRLGDGAKDLFILDNTYAVTKDTKVAFSYYFLADYTATKSYGMAGTPLDGHTKDQDIQLHTFGLSGETKFGKLGLSGFAAMQLGNQKADPKATSGPITSNRQFHGWAANVAAKMPLGPGTAKTAFLYTSGNNSNDKNHYHGWITSSVNSYNESGLMILARNTANSPTSTDRYIRRNVTNIAVATLGYDAKLSEKLYLNANAGFGFAPSSNDAPKDAVSGKQNSSDYMGTEINLETGYKIYKNLTLRAQAAYMILGGYYKNAASNSLATNGKDPENPYTMRLLASFAF